MSRYNDAISAALERPYIERENDCVTMIERAHGISRPESWQRPMPEEDIIAAEVGRYGSVVAAYEAWLRLHFARVRNLYASWGPGLVAVVQPPAPVRPTLGLVDDSCNLRWRAGRRMLSLERDRGARVLSLWEAEASV